MPLSPAFLQFEQGLSYEDFLRQWNQRLLTPVAADRDLRRYYFYAKYNWERSERVHALYQPSSELLAALATLQAPQRWVVLTEDWCGDSAFSLPLLAEAAKRSPLIELRIFPRDEHLDLMDLYLTNGGRSIPKLVAFSEEGAELFQWGPRPRGAVHFREALLAQGLDKQAVIARLTDWYEAGGWNEVDGEIALLLQQAQRIGKVPFE